MDRDAAPAAGRSDRRRPARRVGGSNVAPWHGQMQVARSAVVSDRAAGVGADRVVGHERPVRELDDHAGITRSAGRRTRRRARTRAGSPWRRAARSTRSPWSRRRRWPRRQAPSLPAVGGVCRSGIRRPSLCRRRDDPPATRPRPAEDGGARPSRRAPPRRSAATPRNPALRTTRRSAETGSSVGSVIDRRVQATISTLNRPPVPASASVSQPTAYGRSGP